MGKKTFNLFYRRKLNKYLIFIFINSIAKGGGTTDYYDSYDSYEDYFDQQRPQLPQEQPPQQQQDQQLNNGQEQSRNGQTNQNEQSNRFLGNSRTSFSRYGLVR